MNIDTLISNLKCQTRPVNPSLKIPEIIQHQVVQEKLDFLIDLRSTNLSELRKTLIEYCQRWPTDFNLAACEAVALWMYDRHGAAGAVHGELILAWLAKLDDATASVIFNLAVKLNANIEGLGNFVETFQLLKSACARETEQTLLRGMILTSLASAYLNGQGVKKNFRQAVLCLEEAADIGNSEAMFNLGMLFTGRDVETPLEAVDFELGMKYYEAAAHLGCVRSQTNLGILHFRELVDGADKEYGHTLLRRSAAVGDAIANEALKTSPPLL